MKDTEGEGCPYYLERESVLEHSRPRFLARNSYRRLISVPTVEVPMQVKLKIVESTVKHGSVLEERGPLA